MRKLGIPAVLLCSFLLPFSQAHAASGPAKVQLKAVPLPLTSVRLTGGPLKKAQDLDAEYLLELQPQRMLAYLRQSAGLDPEAQGYGGWDGPGRQLTGHIAGHYLSAVSMMYATTGDVRFKQRADAMVAELQNIQNAQGDGYIGALKDAQGVAGKQRFEDLSKGEIRSGGFDLNGLWSPWYVEHKLFAGLRDAYHLTGNRTALDVEIKFAGWVDGVLANLTDDQIQRMLATEFGGMNEVLADLYVDTNDPRWLKLSDKFEHHAIVDPLANGQDILAGKHANTQVPKMIGELARYIDTGNQTDGKAAEFFFDEVSEHHTFATGGHGKNEYFGQPDKLNDMIDGRTAESCGTYNMIKMARTLFSLGPDARYADFVERADLNAILGGQDPEDGRVSYMVPVGRGVQHEYQTKFDSFTCCVGSQMEMHAFHAYGIYSESGNKLWVSLYAPTTVDWTSQGVKLEMVTDLPLGDSATLKVTSGTPKQFTLALRRPYWAGAGFAVKVNGKPVKDISKPDTYIEISRTWKVGDSVELVLPKTLHKEPLPDNPNRMAILWGPLVLAGDLGPEMDRRSFRQAGGPPPPAPALITAAPNVDGWLKPVSGKPGVFHTVNVGLKQDIDFVPFYEMPRRRYAIYWDVFTPTDWANKSAAYQAEQESQKKLEAATIGFAQPGQMQSERDFAEQGEDTAPVQLNGRYGRQGTNWFSYELPVDPAASAVLIVTFSNEVRGRKGDVEVLVDGAKVGEQTMDRRTPEQDLRFFDVKYPLPLDIVKGKQKVTVRFQAKDGAAIPGIFGIRTVRADAAK
ncbi:MAG TPA: glycoside hydrolase family 127 protein [Acidobacteriaceae bacterium]|nr:glycoside hydrolase family 127 protein [Acidobacteriaceae bacterium]